MGKVKTARKAGAAGSSPYDRHPKTAAKAGGPKTNIFKFNKDVGQHILKNPGVGFIPNLYGPNSNRVGR